MTINKFLEAIAAKLTGLWPDRKVFIDCIPEGADGNFFVGVIETSQEKKLERRRSRSYQFEILYFLSSDDNMGFIDWTETMYDSFEALDVYETDTATRRIALSGQTARKDETGVYQFTFEANFCFVLAQDMIDPMENLDHKEELK